MKRGDLVALRSAGAYGEVMVSRYNLREEPKAYYSDTI
jgi:diaminopimelate decarboxylase